MRRQVPRPPRVLLVEDNQGDVRLTLEAFEEAGSPAQVHVEQDGEAALSYLEERKADSQLPDLILLDLNLPGLPGTELLATIKADATLARIPVVILTSSTLASDLETTYDHHVNCYITKPNDLEAYMRIVQTIDAFWLQVARLPAPTGPPPGG